jgi:hypothetical protein
MSRRCSVCSDPRHHQIDAALLAGTPVREVVSNHEIGESAVYRHVRSHLRAGFLIRAEPAQPLATTNLIQELIGVLADVRAVRTVAIATGQAGLLLRASMATQQLVTALMDRVGVDDVELVHSLREAEQVVDAVADLTRSHPKAGLVLAGLLAEHGAADLSDSLATLAATSQRELATAHVRTVADSPRSLQGVLPS